MTPNENLLISIILPTYNGSKLLTRSIESCLKQTHQNIELIIVDDCSVDNTSAIIRSFEDPRIKYIRNSVNQRLPRSLNIGFEASKGEYLTWTSDDNEFLPSALEEMLAYLKRNPDVDFVYTDMIVRYFETGKEEVRAFSDLNLEKENNVGASYLYTRKVYETIGGYDPRFEWVEDYDYWIRISKQFQMRHYPKALYIYGDHVQSLTNKRRYPIVMMRDALRYWHEYLSLDEFVETIRQFSVDVRSNIEGRDKQMSAFKQTFEKIFGISFIFGMQFLSLFVFLLVKMFINNLLRPIVKPLRKSSDDRRFRKVCAALDMDPVKINVLCIIPAMVVGGSEKVIWDVVRSLEVYGYDFHLICDQGQDNEWCRKFSASFKNVVLLKPFADDAQYQRYLSEMIRRLEIKILLNTNSRTGYRCLPELKSEFPELKAIDILHLEDVGGAIEKYAWAAKHLNRRICISQHLKDYMKDVYRRNSIAQEYDARIEVIHNGTQPISKSSYVQSSRQLRVDHGISEDDVVISFIGRFAQEKKPFLFIDIARIMVAKAPQIRWKFVMAGSGPYEPKVIARINESGLGDRFVLLGMMADVVPLLMNSFLLCVVSRHEGIPLVIQEALALNVPVLSTNVGAIRELIHDGINGYLIDLNENTAQQFAEKAVFLVSDPASYQKLAFSAKDTLYPEFSMDHMRDQYLRIFKDLVKT